MRKNCYKNQEENAEICGVIEVKGKCFKDIKNIKKFYKRCSKDNCEYYPECKSGGVFRTLDCYKNKNRISKLYSLSTGIFIFGFILLVFNILNVSFLKCISLIIVSIVLFDMFFTFLEWTIKKIRENTLYNKLNRIERKIKKQKELEDMDKTFNNPYYLFIKNAEEYTFSLKNLLDKSKNSIIKSKLSEYISKLMKIIDVIKEDNERYLEFAFIFEVQLPEIYNTIKKYYHYLNCKKATKEQEEIIEKYLNNIFLLLEKHQL